MTAPELRELCKTYRAENLAAGSTHVFDAETGDFLR